MKQPLAYVHPEAQVADNVVIEPFVTIDKNVVIEEGTRIGSNVTILEGAHIGKNCKIFPGAVIAAVPQDLKFRGEKTIVKIGDNTTIRECVTVNRGTAAKGVTEIGDNCLIMAYAHIAHDCKIDPAGPDGGPLRPGPHYRLRRLHRRAHRLRAECQQHRRGKSEGGSRL